MTVTQRSDVFAALSHHLTFYAPLNTMAFAQNAGRLLGKRRGILCSLSQCRKFLVPLGIAAAVVQASIYDVPGGYRAVMFDRFSGVKDKVGLLRSMSRCLC